MIETNRFYINGAWVAPSTDDTLPVTDPSTGGLLANVPLGKAADADAAVTAARAAFEGWAQTPAEERAALLTRVIDEVEARKDEFIETIVSEMGMPLTMARDFQFAHPITEARGAISALREMTFEETLANSNTLVVREPVGVVVGITPWNYPLVQVLRKSIVPMATGCTVVLKPTELTPLSAFLFAEVVDSVGLPPGVFNMVTGSGSEIGEALVAHPEVDMVALTGSTRAGRRVSEVASRHIKRTLLELGGKSPAVVLEDGDMDKAAAGTLAWCLLNTGQSCTATSRMLVPRRRQDEAERAIVMALESYRVGMPDDDSANMGPLIHKGHYDRVAAGIRQGVAEGARVVTGGVTAAPPADGPQFMEPTIFADVTPDMFVAREEIFGPVVSIMPYDDEEEAVRLANDTDYGLFASVWSADDEKALKVARRIRAGMIEVNGGAYNPNAPFGGYKQSGRGREGGSFGLYEYLEIKNIAR